MADIFLKIVNMSISASWIVLAVLVLRLLLKKAPKWITVLLWGIVAIRLICPFSIESIMSLIPSAETITKAPDAPRPHFESGVTIIDNQVNDYLGGHYYEGVTRPTGHFVDITTILAIVWLVGIVVLLTYTIISYFRVKNKIGTAVLLRDNIYQSENVVSPFVLGIIKPKIYLPFNMNEQDMEHVIAHENAHIHRKDHWWKPFGFLVLTLHWFNPLMWLGCTIHYIREVVIKEMVLETLQKVAKYVTEYEPVFLYLFAKKNTLGRATTIRNMKSKIEKSKQRIKELDKLIERIYEDNVLGKISDDRFYRMSANFEKEQKELLAAVEHDEQKVRDAEQEKINLNIFLEAIRECTDLKELTPTLVNTLIKRIEVHNSTKDEHGHKHVPIDIYFTAVGIINIPTEEELIAAMEEMREKPLKSA